MPTITIVKHFVTFYSPGTFVDEETRTPIDAWDVAAAFAMAKDITERHDAKPYAFQFTTRSRGDDDLDSKEVARSPMHYFGVKIETIEEISARRRPKERTLLANMRSNGWDRIVTTTSGWKTSRPLGAEDVVLDESGLATRVLAGAEEVG